MRLKSVKWNFLEKVCVYDFFENRFHWLKFRGYRFDCKKINGNQLNWFEVNRCEYHRRIFLEIYSSEVESMNTAFIIGERRIKITPMRGSPGETISYKGNAWKQVSLKVNPGKLIWLLEKLWKLTSSIEKLDQTISSISNLSKPLSTIEKQWKSLSSVRNPIAQFSLEKRSCKHFDDMFSLKKFLLKICLKVVWASLKNLCELIGSPYTSFLFKRKSVKNKFVHGKSKQTLSRTKNPKSTIIEKET